MSIIVYYGDWFSPQVMIYIHIKESTTKHMNKLILVKIYEVYFQNIIFSTIKKSWFISRKCHKFLFRRFPASIKFNRNVYSWSPTFLASFIIKKLKMKNENSKKYHVVVTFLQTTAYWNEVLRKKLFLF